MFVEMEFTTTTVVKVDVDLLIETFAEEWEQYLADDPGTPADDDDKMEFLYATYNELGPEEFLATGLHDWVVSVGKEETEVEIGRFRES